MSSILKPRDWGDLLASACFLAFAAAALASASSASRVPVADGGANAGASFFFATAFVTVSAWSARAAHGTHVRSVTFDALFCALVMCVMHGQAARGITYDFYAPNISSLGYARRIDALRYFSWLCTVPMMVSGYNRMVRARLR